MYLVAVCSCPVGIAHTYMAAANLKKAAQKKGIEIKVETQGAQGVEDEITAEDIARCDACIIASDVKTVEELLEVKTEDGSTVNELIVSKTATIGEKLSLRRFTKLSKNDNESFGEYIHMGGKIAVLTLVENASSEVAREVSMHAAAMRPLYTKSSEVPTEVLEKEKEIMREQLVNEGKPEDRIEQILIGKVKKYYEEVCLENQIFVKAENKETVGEYVAKNGGSIVTMVRYEVGEGIEKKEENFAEEVAKQING